MLALNLIDEDPAQPRKADNPGFSEKNLRELAASIALRGVKTPISVRVNPDAPARFLINHGARRFRASRIADRPTIAAFIDNDYNEADQVVENLQRNELTSREIADYIGRELAKGFKKVEIAKAISKSAAFVSQHYALLDLPDPIAEAFNSGRARDVTVINELVMVYKKEPDAVVSWLRDDLQQLTRGAVKLLRQFLDSKRDFEDGEMPTSPSVLDAEPSESTVEPDAISNASPAELAHAKSAIRALAKSVRLERVIIEVMYGDRRARLLLQRRPTGMGRAWLRFDDNATESEVSLSDVRLLNLLES